jgi:YVTN family beta-propeller protein
MFKQLNWKPFSPSSKVEDQTQAVWELAQTLLHRAEKVERRAEEMEKLAEEAAKAKHSELRARAAWYRAKAERLHQRRTFLILQEEWGKTTTWSQIRKEWSRIQEEKKAGKHPMFWFCSDQTYVLLELLWRFLEAEETQAGGNFTYVTYRDIIYVIDINEREVIDTIDEINAKSTPTAIAITPNGTQAYVSYHSSSNKEPTETIIFVIDADINRVITNIKMNDRNAHRTVVGITFTPDGNRAYAVISSYLREEYIYHTITVFISTDNHTVIATIETRKKSEPTGVAIAPNGKRLYVLGQEIPKRDGVVSIIATDSSRVTATIPLGSSHPSRMAITPDGKRLYVTYERSGIVSVIDTNIDQVIATISVKYNLGRIAISPNSTQAYVIPPYKYEVAVIDINSNTVVDVINNYVKICIYDNLYTSIYVCIYSIASHKVIGITTVGKGRKITFLDDRSPNLVEPSVCK